MGGAASISNSAYLRPPTVMAVSASMNAEGISHRRPSPARAKRTSNREGSNLVVTPVQLLFPPFVAMWTEYRSVPFDVGTIIADVFT
jgi:hypothetical protein